MKSHTSYKVAGIIPARFGSSRFPGKPLVLIGGKPMIQGVYEQAHKVIEIVYVTTDDERIFSAVMDFGGKAVMTSATHQSGTDRCAEALMKIKAESDAEVDIVVNIQGDEPFIKPEQISSLINSFDDESVEIATLIRETSPGEDIFNPNQPKVILNVSMDAVYFSRAAIPYLRDVKKEDWSKEHTFYKHLGLYAYRSEVLNKITLLPRSPLEISESLEQNRWIENGYKIRTTVTEWESIGIDTPEDLEKAILFFEQLL
jgi:3-deoxy-manno-octulosonate cytidylyltransferase (CMP-KDO synthetase)